MRRASFASHSFNRDDNRFSGLIFGFDGCIFSVCRRLFGCLTNIRSWLRFVQSRYDIARVIWEKSKAGDGNDCRPQYYLIKATNRFC